MRKLLTLLIAIALCQTAFADAEKARATLEAILRKDATVTIRPPTIHASDAFTPGGIDKAQAQARTERAARDWPEFLRRFTEASQQRDTVRALKSAVYWNEFFKGGSSDDVMRHADKWTSELLGAVKAQMLITELEPDPAIRSRMIGRLERAKKDLEAWQKNDRESGRARIALGASLPSLLAPL